MTFEIFRQEVANFFKNAKNGLRKFPENGHGGVDQTPDFQILKKSGKIRKIVKIRIPGFSILKMGTEGSLQLSGGRGVPKEHLRALKVSKTTLNFARVTAKSKMTKKCQIDSRLQPGYDSRMLGPIDASQSTSNPGSISGSHGSSRSLVTLWSARTTYMIYTCERFTLPGSWRRKFKTLHSGVKSFHSTNSCTRVKYLQGLLPANAGRLLCCLVTRRKHDQKLISTFHFSSAHGQPR